MALKAHGWTRAPAIALTVAVLLAVLALAAACGGDDSGGITTQKIGLKGGTASMSGGPQVEVPEGATSADGSEVAVGITKSAQKPSLPAGMKTIGDVYEIGPSGTTFAQPVRVTLPIPAGTDPGDVMGVVTLDPETGQWVSVSSSVDAAARTVSAYTKHFSPWGIVGGRSEAAATGGWVKVVNTHPRASGSFPGGKHLPVALENLVCFTAYAPTSPGSLLKPSLNTLIARDQTEIEYWLPVGNYTLEDGKFASEINSDPLYSPVFDWWTRPEQTIVMTPGKTFTFGEGNNDLPPGNGYVQRPNKCAPPGSHSGASPTASGSTPTATTHTQEEVEFFSVTSLGGVDNGATAPTTFTIDAPWLVKHLTTYHWNNATGAAPGTIALKDANGKTYGPWSASGAPGQGGVPNAYWVVTPDEVIPAGTYTVVDSDPSTWAQNSETGGAGLAWGTGIKQ